MDAMRGSSPTKGPANPDSPEQLLDAFKAAALSVTKLYKTSAAAQSKARCDGYQDCLDDLLAFLDKRNIGLSDGEGWQIRKWATERLDGRDGVLQAAESEDEVEKAEVASTPEIPRSGIHTQPSAAARHDVQMRTESAPPTTEAVVSPIAEEPQPIVVPSQENFTFQSSHPYPQESAYLNIEKLALSDSTKANDSSSHSASTAPVSHSSRLRNNKRVPRPRTAGHLGKGAGQKRSINFAELFDVGSIGFGKDMDGREGKRSRHT
ncbi:hypothetical protein DL768_010597 [Monosporascus sp. mg162]|nr:hypothetical protein DL768_010597 [Monosporascus sp. mg162]